MARGRKPKTDEQREEEERLLKRNFSRRQIDYTVRNCLEFVLSLYVVGFLPLAMHTAVSLFEPPAQDDRRWVAAEAWLFVMVTSAASLVESRRERRHSDGTANLIVALFGGLGAITGAFAYALITLQPPGAAEITLIFQRAIWWTVGIVAILYLVIRIPSLARDAGEEAERKVAEENKAPRQKGNRR